MLANVSGVFQEVMSVILEGEKNKVLTYLEYILVFSDRVENHLKHEQKVWRNITSN